jgi:phosphoglycerate dehydrogenase-like enzyme
VKVLIQEWFASELTDSLKSQQPAIAFSLRTYRDLDDPTIPALIAQSDVLVSGEYLPAWRDPRGERPRFVHTVGAGVDGIDIASLPRGCVVCNVYGHERGVAEQAFMLMLALHKKLFSMDAALRRGDWTPQQTYLPELRERRLLILGAGHIGRELTRWGRFLDMHVTVLTRSPSPQRAAEIGAHAIGSLSDLDRHLGDADFIVVAIPSTPQTVGLIGNVQFRLMKPTAFVINVGRAAVIDEEALYDALRTRRIAGAGLDVWYLYPAGTELRLPSRMPFHELDNVIMTPHKPTAETMSYRFRMIAKQIGRFARGEALENVVHVAGERSASS